MEYLNSLSSDVTEIVIQWNNLIILLICQDLHVYLLYRI